MLYPCRYHILCGINLPFGRLSPGVRQVTYALRTRAPVSGIAALPLDLHVLGLSLAFILSQDQTLLCINKSLVILYKLILFVNLTRNCFLPLFFPFALIQYFKDLISFCFMSKIKKRSHPRLYLLCPVNHSGEAGAKIVTFCFTPNIFESFSENIFQTLSFFNIWPYTPSFVCLSPIGEAGAKITHRFWSLQVVHALKKLICVLLCFAQN